MRNLATKGFGMKANRSKGRGKTCGDPRFVAARVGSIPTVTLQEYGDQTVKAVFTCVVERQALITERCGYSTGAKQCGEQVALRVTEPVRCRRTSEAAQVTTGIW